MACLLFFLPPVRSNIQYGASSWPCWLGCRLPLGSLPTNLRLPQLIGKQHPVWPTPWLKEPAPMGAQVSFLYFYSQCLHNTSLSPSFSI